MNRSDSGCLLLQQRYEAMRRWWCSGDGYARIHLGLVALLRQGMSVWMHQPAHAEPREAAARNDLDRPPPTSSGGSDALLSKPLHAELSRILAGMAIKRIEATEQTA